MKKGYATIRDIALKLNISISTVSRALRNMPEVSPQTKREVLEAAKMLHYAPNVVAQNLRTRKTHTLGVIVPEIETHFFATNISGMQDWAKKEGYNIIICQSNESYETEVSNIQVMMSSRVDGLLISLSKETSNFEHLQALRARNVPLVLFDRVCEDIDTTKIIVDDRQGALKATEHLIQQGCKNIAFLGGPQHLLITQNRLQGYKDALSKHSLAVPEALVRYCDFSAAESVQQTNALLDGTMRPDAIVAINDPVAFQVMLLLKERGINIPREIAVVGFTNEPASALVEPSLTTVAQPGYKLGQIAVQQILGQIRHPADFIPQTITLATELVVRNSSLKTS
ncbi:LacI family DNA-binding transcriptional regulator [Pontibacter sp. CAU 1760]